MIANSLLAPFAMPFCLSLASSAIGIYFVRRKLPSQGLLFYLVIYLGSIFGATLLGRLVIDIATFPLSILLAFLLGALFPVLFLVKIESANN